MKEYELVVLFDPSLEVDLTPALDKVAKIIKDAGGEIVAQDDWGRKRLAYTIAKQDFAIYRVYTLNLPSTAPAKIDGALNISSEVIRHLLVKVDPKAKAALAEAKAKAAEKSE
ncbi:MAG: 30S ribosomal protein S6 [Candidatus Nomurabacteria bacterium]|nr:30S ribosomal protein S6 [Candidatus Nomurabacteria bacterium]